MFERRKVINKGDPHPNDRDYATQIY